MSAANTLQGVPWRRNGALTVAAIGVGLFVGFACVILPPVVPLTMIGLPALMLLWVMPNLERVPQRWVSLAVVPFIVSILCVPVYYAIILPGVPWISIRRVILYAMIAPLLIVLSGSSNIREVVSSRFSASKIMRAFLIAYMIMLLVSTLTSIHLMSVLNFDLMIVTTCFLPMVAVMLVVNDERNVLVIFKVLIMCMVFNLCIGAIEHVLQRPFLVYLLPSFMRDQIIASNPQAIIGLITGQGFRGGFYRAASTFTGSLTWGESTAMIAPMCLHFVAHGSSRSQRCYGLVGMVLCLLSVFFSGSRGAYVGLIAATVIYSIIWSLRACRYHPENLGGKIGLFFYMIGSVTTVLAVLFVPRIHNMVLGGGDAQLSTDGRRVEWELAKPKIWARPLWGYGGGTASEVIGYTPTGFSGDPTTVDGYFMNLLVDHGIPGFLAFSGIFFSAAIICLWKYYNSNSSSRTWGAAVGTSIVAFIVYRTTLSQIDNLSLAFVLIGLALVYCSGFHGGKVRSRFRSG